MKRFSGTAVVDLRQVPGGYQANIYTRGKKGHVIRHVQTRSADQAAKRALAGIEGTAKGQDGTVHLGDSPDKAYPAALVKANPDESTGLSTGAMVGLGMGAVAIVGLGLFYFSKQQAKANFGTGSVWGPPSFQLAPAARAAISPTPAVSPGLFVVLIDVVASVLVVAQVTAVQQPLATGSLVAVGTGSTMAVGQSVTFNTADVSASSATLAAVAQMIAGKAGTARSLRA